MLKDTIGLCAAFFSFIHFIVNHRDDNANDINNNY